MAKSICVVEGCGKPMTGGKGYCGKHYMCWRKWGDPCYQRPVYSTCTVAGCERKPRSRHAEHCETHYYRLRRTGSTDDPQPPKRFVDYRGYALVKSPGNPMAGWNGWVYEHRLVAEQKLGRALMPAEYVHHIDCNTTNNHPDNLMVVSSGEHRRIHLLIDAGVDPRVAAKWEQV